MLVRKVPLTMSQGAVGIATPDPDPFDTFHFTFQRSYVYQGGDLVFFITHDGNDQASACYLEGKAKSANQPGRALCASTYQATTATTTNTTFTVTRIHHGYGPACVCEIDRSFQNKKRPLETNRLRNDTRRVRVARAQPERHGAAHQREPERFVSATNGKRAASNCPEKPTLSAQPVPFA